jgi:retinol dehydrogenase 12
MGDLDGKTFLVTGANTGIGRSTAEALAQRGGRVLVATRSLERTRPVLDAITASAGGDRVEHVPVDLADLDSVAACARGLSRGEPVHVLINNAGVAGQRGETEQGFELAFGINHLGHFLLTTLLLDHLLAHGPARVVNVSSDSHFQPKGIDWDALEQPSRTVTGMREYGVSKLCNVLFTQELARRVPAPELTTYAVHPGVIASDIWRRIPWPVRPVVTRFMKSTEEGAETSVHCATSPEVESDSGRYYEQCREKAPNPVATPSLATELWERSEKWTAAFR